MDTSSYMRQYCKNSCGFCNDVVYVDGKLTEYPNNIYSDQYVNKPNPSRAQAVAVQKQDTNSLLPLILLGGLIDVIATEDQQTCFDYIDTNIKPNLDIFANNIKFVIQQIDLTQPISDTSLNINDIKTATNVIKNIKKIIESNQNNYVNTINAFKNFIINYNNKLSIDINVNEVTEFTIAFNDLVNSISTNILKIQ